MEFFHAPNQSSTILRSFSRALVMTRSTRVKSNLPSWGSMNSQYAGTKTVLRPSLCMRGITSSMSATLVAAELLSSPPSRSIGLPLTTSCVAVPCFCSFTSACRLAVQRASISNIRFRIIVSVVYGVLPVAYFSIGCLENVWKYFRQVSRHSRALSSCTLRSESVCAHSASCPFMYWRVPVCQKLRYVSTMLTPIL